MGKRILELNQEFNKYSNETFNNLQGLSEVDKTIASYLFNLEIIRSNYKNPSFDYVYCSIATLMNKLNIKSNLTVQRSLKRLQETGIIRVDEKVRNGYIKDKLYYPNHDYINFDADKNNEEKTFESLLEKINEMKHEIQELKKDNQELKKEISRLKQPDSNVEKAVVKVDPVQESIIPIDEPVIERRSIEKPQMSARLQKVMKLYHSTPSSISISDKEEEPVIETRNIEPVKSESTPQRVIPKEKLDDSFVVFGTCVIGLDNQNLKKELEFRISKGIETNNVLQEISRRRKIYEERPEINNKGFFILFEDVLKTA